MKLTKLNGIFPVKIKFEDDSFELTTAAFGKGRTLTCGSKKIKKDSRFKVIGVDEKGDYFEAECVAIKSEADRAVANWKN